MPPIEIELKLASDREGLERLREAPMLAAVSPRLRALETVYWDTSERSLQRQGVSLRVRRSGDGHVQTVKATSTGSGALMRRGEWESPVPGAEPVAEVIGDPALRDLVARIAPEELRPVFFNRIERELREVEITDGSGRRALIEVAIDEGRITAGQAEMSVAEVELELIEGNSAALYQLALALHELVPLRLETLAKSTRGYALLDRTPPAWAKAEATPLDDDATVETAFATVLEGCLRHFAANEAAARAGGDPEGIHQLRVALRRLRSALSVFREVIPQDHLEWLQTETRRLAKGLGPARDLDVFQTELLAPIVAARPKDEDLEALDRLVTQARARANDDARSVLADARTTTLFLRLGLWLESRGWRVAANGATDDLLERPATALADALLAKRHRRLLREGEDFATLDVEARHQVRIAVKKLRYTIEFFRDLYPKKRVKAFLKALAKLQTDLGHLNDLGVAERLLGELLPDAPRNRQRACRRAAGLVIGWYARPLADDEKAIVKHWNRFEAAEPFWSDPD